MIWPMISSRLLGTVLSLLGQSTLDALPHMELAMQNNGLSRRIDSLQGTRSQCSSRDALSIMFEILSCSRHKSLHTQYYQRITPNQCACLCSVDKSGTVSSKPNTCSLLKRNTTGCLGLAAMHNSRLTCLITPECHCIILYSQQNWQCQVPCTYNNPISHAEPREDMCSSSCWQLKACVLTPDSSRSQDHGQHRHTGGSPA